MRRQQQRRQWTFFGKYLALVSIFTVAIPVSGEEAPPTEVPSTEAPSTPSTEEDESVDQQSRKEALERFSPFMDPPTFERAPYWGNVTLTINVSNNSLNNKCFRHMAYNGGLVGPTIRVQRGDKLEVRVENQLKKNELGPDLDDGHGPHGFYSTNLHPHGLHISPSGESDNTFIRLDPGDSFTFRFEIPWNQPQGTFWYHPHKHGGVAYQLTNGLAGALIVEGGLDWAPELDGVEERVMVFQQFRYREGPDGIRQVYPEDIYTRRFGSPPISTGAPRVPAEVETAINGVVTPMITMRPGEVQRWRMIHAGVDSTIKLNIEKEAGPEKLLLHEIAVDGIALGKVVPREVVVLQPGYRSDVLVQARTRGTYLLYTEVKESEKKDALKERAVPRTYVAKIFVDGTPRNMRMPPPTAFNGYGLPDLTAPIAKTKNVVFDRGESRFTVNDKEFDVKRIDHLVQLGTAEEWIVGSQTEGHPFHVHVNPFKVLQPDGAWVWRDTYFVPPGQTARLQMQFDDYDGTTVMHCHNLDHEDQGMMQMVRIAKDARAEEAAMQKKTEERLVAQRNATLALPAWQLSDTSGKLRTSEEYRNQKLLLVFHRGVGCPLCAEQVIALAARDAEFKRLGYQILAIGPRAATARDSEFAIQNKITFPLLADPGLNLFRALNLVPVDEPPSHGIFLVDRNGAIRWSKAGDEPAEPDAVLKAAEELNSILTTQTLSRN